MRSARPKVLHEVAGESLLAHVLHAVTQSGDARIAVVVGPQQHDVAAEARRIAPNADVLEQRERLGTAHAVLAAKPAIAKGPDDILVLFGAAPLIRPAVLRKLRNALSSGAGIALLGFRPADPTGYGRLLMKGNELLGVR